MSRLARAFGDAEDSRNLRVRGEGGNRIENVENEKQKQEMEVKQQKQKKKKNKFFFLLVSTVVESLNANCLCIP